jgi:hypothetical protein
VGNPKINNVVEKFDPAQLAEHQSNLDAAYRQLQRAYKAMTYEVGRLEDEPGLSFMGQPAADRLAALSGKLQALGNELKAFTVGTEEMDAEEDNGPQGAD